MPVAASSGDSGRPDGKDQTDDTDGSPLFVEDDR